MVVVSVPRLDNVVVLHGVVVVVEVHVFNQVFVRFSEHVLVHQQRILVDASTAGNHRRIPIFKTLNCLGKHSIVLPVLHILSFHLLEVSRPLDQLMPLLSQLLLVLALELRDFLLKVYLLLVACRSDQRAAVLDQAALGASDVGKHMQQRLVVD